MPVKVVAAGVTDHGLLTGLGDHDHPDIYYSEAEVDAKTWDASDIVSGTLNIARIPAIHDVDSATESTNITTTSTSWVDMSGMSISMTVGANPVLVLAHFVGRHSDTAAVSHIRIIEDSTELCVAAYYDSAASYHNLSAMWLYTASAGAKTYKIQWKTSAGTLACEKATSPDYADRRLTVIEIVK